MPHPQAGTTKAASPNPFFRIRAAWALGFIAGVIALGSGGMALDGEPALHLRLDRTEPAAGEALTAPPSEIRLFFSEPPQMRGTSVRLADAGGELVATTDAEADGDDPREVYIRPDGELADGQYTVHWRVIAQDGHAQNGTFEFRVQAVF